MRRNWFLNASLNMAMPIPLLCSGEESDLCWLWSARLLLLRGRCDSDGALEYRDCYAELLPGVFTAPAFRFPGILFEVSTFSVV